MYSIFPFINALVGHSQPHCFRFTLNEISQAVMHYKKWSNHGWSEEALLLFLVSHIIL